MQNNILEKYPSSKLRVYVIWLPMIWTDARAAWRWTGGVIADSRVEHFWDEKRMVGRWFAGQESSDGGIVWDAYFLYGPEAQWDTKPAPLIGSGGTILDQFDELEKKLVPLLRADGT